MKNKLFFSIYKSHLEKHKSNYFLQTAFEKALNSFQPTLSSITYFCNRLDTEIMNLGNPTKHNNDLWQKH